MDGSRYDFRSFTNGKAVSRTSNSTEPKAAAIEDPILDQYPHEIDNDINEEHPEAETVDVVDAKADDRSAADDTHNRQSVKANLSEP